MVGYIYNLWDKDESDIFYVGSTINPKQRLMAHNSAINYSEHETDIITNRKPSTKYGMDILEEIEFEESRELLVKEAYWINQMIAWGFNLKNTRLYKTLDFNYNTYSITQVPKEVYYYVLSVQNKLWQETKIKYSVGDTVIWILQDYERIMSEMEVVKDVKISAIQ